jgi:chromate transporter
VVNLIPGPNSTQMAMQISYRVAGWPGLVVGGSCFILPAALLTLLLAWLYVSYGALPQAGALLHGVKAVMVAVVAQAIWNLSRTAVKSAYLGVIGGLAVLASGLGVNALLVLLGAGVLACLRKVKAPSLAMLLPGAFRSWFAGALPVGVPFGLFPLFVFFLKIGAVVFGSGYVLLAFLRSDLVVRLQWLTDQQLLDAIAVGQLTPGPVFTTATFIGYLLGRVPGAVDATVGIFLPSFVFIAIIGPLVPYLRKSAVLGAFLDGVNAGALALMVVVTWYLGRVALVDASAIALAGLSLIALLRFKVNATWLILAGAVVGILVGRTHSIPW